MTIEELLEDRDWAEVFADYNSGNVSKDVQAIGDCPDHEFSRSDVVEIMASRDGENDGPDWIGVFRLRDGRFAFASGGCDYTGWD